MTLPTTDDVMPPVALVLPDGTPAQMADAMQRTIYAMRDRLMSHYAYSEHLATEVATLVVDTLRAVSDIELVAAKSAAKRAARRRRDAEIRRDIRPGNAPVLAKRHGLTVRQVYRIANSR